MDITFKLKDPYETIKVVDRTKFIGKIDIKIKIVQDEILKNRNLIKSKTTEQLQGLLHYSNHMDILNDIDDLVCLNCCLEELVDFYKQIKEQQESLQIKISDMTITDL